jgi:hypothetical protein
MSRAADIGPMVDPEDDDPRRFVGPVANIVVAYLVSRATMR